MPEHRTTERAALTRERIVVAAIELVDAEGLAALSMRRLGADLGFEAMALYRHVNGREDLLEAVVDHLTAQMHLSDEVGFAEGSGWPAYLQWLAHTVRDVAYAHPQLFPLIATRHPAAPWLRPPLRSLQVVEDFLDQLIGRGFSDDQAVVAYRTFSSFLIGQLLLSVSQRASMADAVGEPMDEGDDGDESVLALYPEVRRLEGKLSEDHADEEFERALEDLLERIAAEKRALAR